MSSEEGVLFPLLSHQGPQSKLFRFPRKNKQPFFFSPGEAFLHFKLFQGGFNGPDI